MKFWHNILPQQYGAIEKFNHQYPLRHLPSQSHFRTIEIGAGVGGHLEFEDLSRQDYYCIELRENMAAEIRKLYPTVKVITASCQDRTQFEDAYFDRAVAVHVLEHLPDLPRAISELHRILRVGGILLSSFLAILASLMNSRVRFRLLGFLGDATKCRTGGCVKHLTAQVRSFPY